jgi:hypothetical protein
MPNVPNVPGVPPLSSYGANDVILLTADVISAIAGFSTPVWGIYLDGVPVIAADNQVTFGLKQDFPISNYPQEQGAFQNYDKVQLPMEIRARFSAGGSEIDRQNFLASIDAVMNTVDLYDVVTPEQVYQSFNFTHRDLERTAENGVGLIVVDLWLEEIRVTSTATFQNTANPSVAGQQGSGNVQAQTPNATVQQEFEAGGFN